MSLVSIASRRALAANAVGNTLGMLAQLAVSFFMAPVMLRVLGSARNGVWNTVESFQTYLLLFDFGVAAALVRFVPRHVATDDRDGLNRVFSTSMVFFGGAAVAVAIIGGIVSIFIAHLFHDLPAALVGQVRVTFLIAVLTFAVSLPLGVFPSILDGLGALGAKNAARTCILILRVPCILAVLGTDAVLQNMALVLAGCTLLENLIHAILVFRRLPDLRFVPSAVTWSAVREIRGYSLNSFLAMLAGRLSFQTDNFVIGGFLGPVAITYFGFGNKLVDLSKSVLRSPMWALTPAVSAMDARGAKTAVRSCYLRGSRFAIYLALPVQAGLYIFGPSFLAIWLRDQPEVVAAAVPVMNILAIMLSLTVAQSVSSRVLHGLGSIRIFSRAAILEGIVNVGLSIALVGPLGIEGVAWGTVVPHVAFCLFVLGHLGRMIDVRPGEYLKSAVAAPVLATTPAVFAWLFLTHIAPPTGWLVFVAEGFAGLLPAAAVALAIDGRSYLNQFRRPAVTTPSDKSTHSQPPLRAAG